MRKKIRQTVCGGLLSRAAEFTGRVPYSVWRSKLARGEGASNLAVNYVHDLDLDGVEPRADDGAQREGAVALAAVGLGVPTPEVHLAVGRGVREKGLAGEEELCRVSETEGGLTI